MSTITLDPDPLQWTEVLAVARHGARVRVTEQSLDVVHRFRQSVEQLAAAERPVY